MGLVYVPFDDSSTDRNAQGDARWRKVNTRRPGASVTRQDERRPVPEPFERPGQRPGDVGQTARLGEWDRLGGHHHYVHP